MTVDVEAWRITRHAAEQMELREISSELVHEVVRRPSQTLPDPKGKPHCRYYVGHGIIAVVDEEQKAVMTVLLDGASSTDWEDFLPKPAKTAGAPEKDSDGSVSAVRPVTGRRPGRRAHRPLERRTRVRVAEVETRSVLDDVHPGIAARVRQEMTRRGLDFRAVRIFSPTHVELMPPR